MFFRQMQETPASQPTLLNEEGGLDIDALRERVLSVGQTALDWVREELLHPASLIQLSVIIGVILIGVLIAPSFRRWLMMGLPRLPDNWRRMLEPTLPQLVRPLLWACGMWVAQTAMMGAGQPATFVRIATSLATAWLIIRTATSFLPAEYRKPVSWLAWIIAGLNVVGLLGPTLNWLDNNGVPFGGSMITIPLIVRAILFSGLFLYIAQWLSKQLRSRIDTLPRVDSSLRVLIGHAVHVALIFGAVLLALTSLNIPLGGLAVLGGALGVGIGFGMQQIVANFISGVILLTDRSIKPDDVIEVDETYGVVRSLGLRYASVITRDGKEHLIPNEQLVTNKVVNWSYSDNKVRIKRRIRVEYETELKLAVGLAIDGAGAIDRVLKDPKPNCLVMEFGDEAVELEVRFWISDPQNGVSNVGSDVMLAIWDRFKEHGIDIPLRQEEILIQPGSTLQVKMVKDDD
ncbi:MAG: mechanosensitive ion channel protein MscS [Hirschia sp.]|nr:mechanosensitive ion channel protein MscS [Hirschia sp.]MBF19430.1 mechanosensitive ion channel protein MscS [Hirschia sp.]